MNLRDMKRLLLTTTLGSIPRRRSVRRLVFLPSPHVELALGRNTESISLGSLDDRDPRKVIDGIWAERRRRGFHHVVILATPEIVCQLALELDRTSWEDALAIGRRGGVMGFEYGRLKIALPGPRSIEDLMDRHPIHDIDLG